MALLMGKTATEAQSTVSGFQYSTVKMEMLGASEYTIVQIIVDLTGSVQGFRDQIVDCLKLITESCKKHPRVENILIRVCTFNSRTGSIEVHGFVPLSSVDVKIYDGIDNPYGSTPLMDAHLNALESLFQYGTELINQQYTVNSVLFVLTDGEENSSKYATMDKIVAVNTKLKSGDPIESFTSILVGFNDQQCSTYLLDYQQKSGIDAYKSVGDATPNNLAKLANFVSQSVSTVSVACGGGNSVQLSKSIASVTF